MRFFFSQCLYILLAILFTYELQTRLDYVFPTIFLASLFSFACAWLWHSAAYVLAGVALCVLPAFGPGSLGLFYSLWLLGDGFRSKNTILRERKSKELRVAVIVLLGSLFVSFLYTFFLEFDPYLLSAAYQQTASQQQTLWSQFLNLPVFAFSWGTLPFFFCDYIVAVLLMYTAARHEHGTEEEPRGFTTGLALGAMFAVAYGLLQISRAHPFFYQNMNPFWDAVGRFGASFSDPNAFGIMTVLIVPVLLLSGGGEQRWREGWLLKLSAMLLLGVSLWSGSRTLWLGFFLWFLLYVGRWLAGRVERSAGVIFSIIICLIFGGLTLVGKPDLNESLQEYITAPGGRRLLQTLHWDHSRDMLESRVLFTKLSLEVAKQRPWVGVGLTRYQSALPMAAEEIGVELHDWRDNANNYYLHVLAEEGLIGLVLTLLAFYLLSTTIREDERTAGEDFPFYMIRWTFLIFLVLLLTGPHLHFEEVLYFLALMMGFGVRRGARRGPSLPMMNAFSCLAAMLLFQYLVLSLNQVDKRYHLGFYPRESGQEVAFAWSVQKARLTMCDHKGGDFLLRVRSLDPKISSTPQVLHVQAPLAGEKRQLFTKTLTLKNREWHTLEFPKIDTSLGPVPIRIYVNRLWSPKERGIGDDPRWLGVMVEWPKGACP